MNSSELIRVLERNHSAFAAVVNFDSQKDKLSLLDLSVNNKTLTDDILNDTKTFSEYINRLLENKKARYLAGGYAEHRSVYSNSKVFDGKTQDEEPRRLHLGIDIWGKPNTAVLASLNG